jgi:tRNA nucleotidyltransferase (CCA-adding enzyme)
VQTSLIRQDLYRRDFTINSLAVALHGDEHGQLVDFFGGRKDLQRRDIRVLHSLSFIDDPTRAIRAVRYARRLEFRIAPDTRNLIETAIDEGVFERLSGQRLRRELEVLLAEEHPTSSVELLAELGLLPAICNGLTWSGATRGFLLEVENRRSWFELEGLGPSPDPLLLMLGALALHAGNRVPRRLADRLQLTGEQRHLMVNLDQSVAAIRRLGGPDHRRSSRVHAVEKGPPEAVLLAMSGVDLEAARRLAEAVEASVRVRAPVTGRQLVDAGVPPGPWVGRALRLTRDAIVDGTIGEGESLDFAIKAARQSLEAAP